MSNLSRFWDETDAANGRRLRERVEELAKEWDARADHFDTRPNDPNWYARRVIYEQHAAALRALL